MKNMNELKNQEVNRVKRTILVDAAVILAMIQEIESAGGETEYRKGQYNELLTLLDVLYDMSPRRTNRVLRKSVQGIKNIDYKAVFEGLGVE